MDDVEFTKKFDRGLNDEAVDAAAEFFSQGLGRDIISHTDFRVFIRKNYMDFYWNGCRVLSYKPLAPTNRFKTNRAYIQDNVSASDRMDVSLTHKADDLFFDNNSFRERLLDRTEQSLAAWVKGNAKGCAGEKVYLYQFCAPNSSRVILDLEIAFSKKFGDRRPHADRLDLAIVEPDSPGDTPTIQFVEAKRDVDSRLRSREGEPPVIRQMLVYHRFLQEKKEEIVNSYKRVAANIHILGIASHFFHHEDKSRADEWFQMLSNNIEIDPQPCLMVFQTKEEWNRNDERHWDRLNDYLQKNNLPVANRELTQRKE